MSLITLDPLPSEVRSLIFECLQKTTHKPTLASLARVSRSIYAQSIPRLYKRVRLNTLNVEAFFGSLISDGLGGIDREISAHELHVDNYLGQLEANENYILAVSYIPSPIARKNCQIWQTSHVLLEDGTSAAYLQEALTSFKYLRRQLWNRIDGLDDDDRDWRMDRFCHSLFFPGTFDAMILGESLCRCFTLYPEVWKGAYDMLTRDDDLGVFTSLCLHLLPVVQVALRPDTVVAWYQWT
ncbi:hypothetical protein I350_07008 [Cryptococcus amylolentus CBS 6273]|uniref:Uncharacterized protein n=1 Tax=Cryptococcus amylolentus CBS 6273 TaxID=1296118 RepID=A0A1E3JKA6_9TREE|nr:hypothetical protein I350_07008 [Cryptococcus amylolentus CBS 6273]